MSNSKVNSALPRPVARIGPFRTDLFCDDLPSRPRPEIGKVLVTGATGYIGGRLVPELLARGYDVRVMVRADSREYRERWPDAEIVVADALDLDALRRALEGIDSAFYLIHSMLFGRQRFESLDIQAASNFRKAAEEKNVRRIIYLGGLGDVQTPLSSHLRSRMEVGNELRRGKVETTVLRAAVIIGSGSASYELIKHLVMNFPILLVPSWARTECQPIGIRDVIKYLVGVLEISETSGKSFDIGGRDVLTYAKMLKVLANLLGRRVLFIPSPVSWIGPYAYLANLFTPVPGPIIWCLLEGIRNRVVCQNNQITRFLPFRPLSYKEAVLRAMTRDEQDRVHTRWSDAYPPAHDLAIKLHELETPPRYTSSSSVSTRKSASSLFQSICKIGGKGGWFHNNWIWRLRGMIDRLFMGVGTSRGRRSSTELRINDVIDFWRVEALEKEKRLLLRAEMRLPGKAWLEFVIAGDEGNRRLSVNAYYQPHGLFGKIYWYLFLPFHQTIFHDLIRQIEKRG
ncbi:MAG: SDR family oxidoreductase [Desulfobacterales bacterium]|nr:SDR family oxidoreductase [Desulfobacterales bacterium]